MITLKKITWLGDSREQLRTFPEPVKDTVGYVLHKIQEGLTPKQAKPLTGFKPAVMEIVARYNTNTYRAAYTIKLDEALYVLHCFNKKSTQGIKTPKQHIQLIKQRLKEAMELSHNKRATQ